MKVIKTKRLGRRLLTKNNAADVDTGHALRGSNATESLLTERTAEGQLQVPSMEI